MPRFLFFCAVWIAFVGLAIRHFGHFSHFSDDGALGAGRVPASVRTLYERFGGKAAFATWSAELEKFVDADARLAANVRFKARWAGADRARVRQGFADYLCERVGGPCRYAGPPLQKVLAPTVFGAMEWVYLKEDALMALRKSLPETTPEDRAMFEQLLSELQAQASQEVPNEALSSGVAP